MKRWPMAVALLYALTFLALTVPVTRLLFAGYKDPVNPWELFRSWEYWLWLAVLAVNPWALLALPVDLSHKRPAAQRSIVFQITASAFLMSLLVAGLSLSVSEAIKKDQALGHMGVIFLGVLAIFWIFWAFVFARWSRKLEVNPLVQNTCRLLFRGSVLQLLIVVPCHILARSRDYCCAGFGTAIGLACGLAVMFISFGPGIFLLYADHWRKLHPHRS